MKKSIVLTAISFAAVVVGASVASFWPGEVMSKSEVGRRWGKAPFEKSRFKSGSEDQRAKMTFDLLDHKKDFIGVNTMKIREQLGDFDGFYFRDSIPTYVVHSDYGDHKGSWQVVFLLDNDFNVSDVIVHKMRQLD